MSDSVRPHRQQPTRLPRPWDSPGKNTGVGCHFLLQCMKVKRESEVAQSCPTRSVYETKSPQSLSSFKKKKNLGDSFSFSHINYRLSLSSKRYQKSCWDFYWECISSINLWDLQHLHLSLLPIYEQDICSIYSFHFMLLILSCIFQKNCLSFAFYFVSFYCCYCKCDFFFN